MKLIYKLHIDFKGGMDKLETGSCAPRLRIFMKNTAELI
jgi:hypothetical protein